MHDSGVHATVAGVLLGLLTRVKPDPDEEHSPAERLEHRVRPVSAGVAVPAFAFLSAGVALTGDFTDVIVEDAAALGVVLGLVVGKFVGVLGATWLVARFTHAELGEDIAWRDMTGTGLPVRDRLHGVPPHRRTGVRDRSGAAQRRQDGNPGGVGPVSAVSLR